MLKPSFQPGEREIDRALDDRRTEDRELQARALAQQQLGEPLGVRVRVGPAELLRAIGARLRHRLAQALALESRDHVADAAIVALVAALGEPRDHVLPQRGLGLRVVVLGRDLGDDALQVAILRLRVDRLARRRVLEQDVLRDEAVALAGDVARGHVQHHGVIALLDEVRDVERAVDVRRGRIAQVGVEVDEPGEVQHDVDVARESFRDLGREPESRLADVAGDDFDAPRHELAHAAAVGIVQRLEGGTRPDDLLEALRAHRDPCRARAGRRARSGERDARTSAEPNLSQESGSPREQDVLPGQGLADRDRRACVHGHAL